jgi:hypothetical protein
LALLGPDFSLEVVDMDRVGDTGQAAPDDRRKCHRGKAKTSESIDKGSPIDPPCIHEFLQTDPLKAVVDALWDRLSDDAKAAIAKMVEALAK